jgi:threonine/homoserine/homoserine lactone efflux protein
LVVALAAILSPGPDTLLVLRATLDTAPHSGEDRVARRHGHGFAAVLGVQIGLLGHLAAAVFGLSLVLLAAPLALQGIALAGALYLCWLGYRNLRAGATPAFAFVAGDDRPVRFTAVGVCRDALLTNLLNPKVILLFVALMPGFVAPERASVPLQLALLGVSIILINSLWQSALVLAAARARRWLARPRVQRALAVATGLVFFAFAGLMVAEFVAAPA